MKKTIKRDEALLSRAYFTLIDICQDKKSKCTKRLLKAIQKRLGI